ncbi:MAG: exodeoxyribonuclease VII large subunit [Woeseiaceae bacterium]|nr:exodeoxyribonuclease VII large subunit [Woeseiaceae bacterium]
MVSNLARPGSGHIYFSLKDESAQVRAAWFRQRQRGPALGLKDGDRILVFARVSLYEARGEFQLIVEQLEPAGEGALRRQYEVLKKKLAAEGLFDEDRKQALPAVPGRIGVITSPTGAAVRDILTVLARRFPSVPVVIYPAAVQGEAAVPELLAALAAAVRRAECDVLIIGRGGGSLEDLWAFNDEGLARAIAACPIPVVSAVGHEVDFTIADFVADVRAPTPSGAAEIVVPSRADWLRAIASHATRLARTGRRALEDRAQALDWLARRLLRAGPQATLTRQEAEVRELGRRLAAAMRERALEYRPRLAGATGRLTSAARVALADAGHRLGLAARGLNAVSPLATLERGYAIVEDLGTGGVLVDAANVKKGDAIRARLARGILDATVTRVEPGKS